MNAISHTAVSLNWHRVDSPQGVFFGYSREEAIGKASQAATRAALERAARGERLPLTPRQRRVAFRLFLRETCMRRAQRVDILNLPALRAGRAMSQQEITDAVGRDWNTVRAELYELVTAGKLQRSCALGVLPATYRLAEAA